MKKVAIILAGVLASVAIIGFLFLSSAGEPSKVNIAKSTGEKISAIIVPHFNDFATKRTELFKGLSGDLRSKTAVVVSVNHFNSGEANIITAERAWKLNGGNMESNSALAKSLTASGVAQNDSNAFNNEHGITNVLPDIRDNIGSNFLPIIIRDTTTKDEVDKLADWISNNCQNSVVVASVDFSHYQPNAMAKIHDSYSIQALNNLDLDKTWAAETDSPQTLYLTEKIAQKSGEKDFHLFYNSNSGEINGNSDAETTSVVLGYYSDKPTETAIEKSTSFVIAGDAMFDRSVWNQFKTSGIKHVFDNFGPRVFRGVDLGLINLEGPVSATPVQSADINSLSFNFQPQIPAALKSINVNTVSLANNHTGNAGVAGLSSTRSMLDKSGIKYFGQPEGFGPNVSVLRVDGQVPLTVIGVMALSSFNESNLEKSIKDEKAAGQTVLVFPHWGTEYALTHSSRQEQLAASWTAAGADIIIGSHPHVTEDFAIVNRKPVVYSLGNFVFDQYFSQNTQEGLIVAGTVTAGKITLSFLPTVEKNIKPQLMAGADKSNKIKTILDLGSGSGFKNTSGDTIEITR